MEFSVFLQQHPWQRLLLRDSGGESDFSKDPASLMERLGQLQYAQQIVSISENLRLRPDKFTRDTEYTVNIGVRAKFYKDCESEEDSLNQLRWTTSSTCEETQNLSGYAVKKHSEVRFEELSIATSKFHLEISDYLKEMFELEGNKLEFLTKRASDDRWSSIDIKGVDQWFQNTNESNLDAILRATQTEQFENFKSTTTTTFTLEFCDSDNRMLEVNFYSYAI